MSTGENELKPLQKKFKCRSLNIPMSLVKKYQENKVTASEVMLAVMVDALVECRGIGCWASNASLGEMMQGHSGDQIGRMVKNLMAEGVLRRIGYVTIRNLKYRILEASWSRSMQYDGLPLSERIKQMEKDIHEATKAPVKVVLLNEIPQKSRHCKNVVSTPDANVGQISNSSNEELDEEKNKLSKDRSRDPIDEVSSSHQSNGKGTNRQVHHESPLANGKNKEPQSPSTFFPDASKGTPGIRLAKRLQHVLIQARIPNRRKAKIKSWGSFFNNLLEDVPFDEIAKMIDLHGQHVGIHEKDGEYWPKAYCGESFAKKYQQILDAQKRCESRAKTSPDDPDIRERIVTREGKEPFRDYEKDGTFTVKNRKVTKRFRLTEQKMVADSGAIYWEIIKEDEITERKGEQ